MLSEVIELRRLNVVNASDGAFIPYAVPRVPEAIDPPWAAARSRRHHGRRWKRSLNEITPAVDFRRVRSGCGRRQADRMCAPISICGSSGWVAASLISPLSIAR